ncbi:LuxR family transcriptional regulator [Crossiella cryophila]
MPLVGRAEERTRIAALLTAADQGRSGVLVLRGEAGIGKTALLDFAVEQAGALRVLRTRCVQTEADLAFSALTDLLHPAADVLDRLPPPRRRALRICLGIEDPDQTSPASPVTTGLATLDVLGELAPALVVIDDMQWMDAASRDAVLFAARRLHGEGVALIVAERPGHEETATAPVLHLPGLNVEAAGELVAVVRGRPPGPVQLQELMRHSQGNPLALIELAKQGDRRTRDPATAVLPVPEVIAAAYRSRLERLRPGVRRGLLVCAASFTGEVREIAAALCHSGLRELAEAEDGGLVTIGDRIEFVHPLLRSTVYHDASPSQRRAAHQRLAQTGAEPGSGHRDQRAWHAAAATLGPDPAVADALERLGEDSRVRGALRETHRAFLRAAELSVDDATRARRALAAATAAQLAGHIEAAADALDLALRAAPGPRLLAEIEQVRTQIGFTRSAPAEVFTAVSGMAGNAAQDAPDLAATLWTTAAGIGAVAGLVAQASQAAEHACHLARGEQSTMDAQVLRAHTLLLTGDSASARRILDTWTTRLAARNPLEHGTEVFGFATMDLMWLDDHTTARAILVSAITEARRAEALERLSSLLSVLADLEVRLGRWHAAYSAAAECQTTAETLGQPLLAGYGASSLARVDAAQGNQQQCLENAGRTLALLLPAGADLVTPYAELALGQLWLSLGDHDRAADQLLTLARRVHGLGVVNPVVFPYHTDLVAALWYSGRHEEASAAVADLDREVGRCPTPSNLATLAHCRGLVTAEETETRQAFEDALTLNTQLGNDFTTARTRMAYGERLRRARRRSLAQEQLTQAAAAFERLRATPWLHRANGELQIGLNRPRQDISTLTSHETRIVHLVADGLSNREIALKLFLSVKTVEYHLGNVYRKLGVRARVELVRLWSGT